MMCQSPSMSDKAQNRPSLGQCDVQVPGLDQSRFIELSGGTLPPTSENLVHMGSMLRRLSSLLSTAKLTGGFQLSGCK